MADYTVYEGVVAYAKQLLMQYAVSCRTAIFNDPNNQILSVKGKETAIREVETKGASDYTGVWGDGIDTASSDYVLYYAPNDRAFSASIDSLKEAQSFVEGATPTLKGVAAAFNRTKLAPEIDAVLLARYASQVATENKHLNSEEGWKVDKDNIIETLTNIEAAALNAGYADEIVVFLSSIVNAAFEKALLDRNILANDIVIKRSMTREEIADGFGTLEIEIKAKKLNNLIIMPTPDDRMIGKVLMLNGIDPGQEEGGVLPQKNVSTYFDINILAIPMTAAYANVRHIVSNMAVPVGFDIADYQQNIAEINRKLFGTVQIENAGINQIGDAFKFNERCVYGGDIFKIYRNACVLVKSADGAVTVAPKTAVAKDPEAGSSTTNATVRVYFGDSNCSGTAYFESAATGTATVDASKAITVPSDGAADTRPYADVTVRFGATSGSSIISVFADSAKTKKIGEFKATSLGA